MSIPAPSAFAALRSRRRQHGAYVVHGSPVGDGVLGIDQPLTLALRPSQLR